MALNRLLCSTSLTTVFCAVASRCDNRVSSFCVFFLRCPYSSLSVLVTKTWKCAKNVFERRGIAHVVRCFSSLNIVQGERTANALTAILWPTVETVGIQQKVCLGSKSCELYGKTAMMKAVAIGGFKAMGTFYSIRWAFGVYDANLRWLSWTRS